MIGTAGCGYRAGSLVPGPQMPNGMIRPGPDTSRGPIAFGFHHFGGYYFPDTHIQGFSHTRLVGAGINEQGNLRLMPVMRLEEGATSEHEYRSPFDHSDEIAAVGYYRIVLQKTGIAVELAAAKRAAMHRITYPLSDKPYLLIDVGASTRRGDVKDGWVQIDPDKREIFGMLEQHGGFSELYGGLQTYFSVHLSMPFEKFGTFLGEEKKVGKRHAEGPGIGVYVGFAEGCRQPVLAKVGLSFIDVDQARMNLETEIPDWNFERLVNEARRAWKNKLQQIEVSGGSETQRRIFYSALYHAYMMPTLFTEHNERYMGFDGKSHCAEGFTYYTDFSLWDTFRTLHPLMALIEPELNRDFVISLLKMAEQGGDLPLWPMGRGYTNVMIGTHADSVIAGAYLKGITGFDVEFAYRKMVEHATQTVPHAGRDDLAHYLDLGYCTTDHTNCAPSKTLEYAYNDYCIAEFAAAIGHEEEAEMFQQRSKNYRHLWDPETQFFRGRDSQGNWKSPFWPRFRFADEYVEGNAWQWLWFVPHDVEGLLGLFGGAEAMVAKLETFFEKATEKRPSCLPDTYYWHGNEPDIHAAYLFALAGRPDLTQKWVRWIMAEKYRDAPDGIDGNDDGGTLSSWYILSALGFYPLNPCDGRYIIGSPIFDRAVLHLPGGDLVITAENNSSKNLYVQSASLNGKPLNHPWFDHQEIINGGHLQLLMDSSPSQWGKNQ